MYDFCEQVVVQTQLVTSEPSVVQNILPQTSQNAVVYNSNAPPAPGIHTLVNAGSGTILTGFESFFFFFLYLLRSLKQRIGFSGFQVFPWCWIPKRYKSIG